MFKIISLDDGQNWEMYDLINDPSETKNIAQQHPKILEDMLKEVKEWLESCKRSSEGLDY